MRGTRKQKGCGGEEGPDLLVGGQESLDQLGHKASGFVLGHGAIGLGGSGRQLGEEREGEGRGGK